MSDHGVGDGVLVGPDFNLPDEILSVIPTDPYDLLDLARKIASMAISSRVSKLEMEISRFKQNLHVKDRVIVELEDKVSQLETAYHKIELHLKITREDNANLLQERDSLALAAIKLGRDLAKLETFKRQLIQSLNGENSPELRKLFPLVSPRRYSAADSPQKTSGTTSPTAQSERYVSSWYASSQQSSGTSTPTLRCPLPACPPRIDRKEFFRQVRNRLSLEQFSAFLANIKELNAQRQSREETLRKAHEIFGIDNKDLYVLFQGLLRHNMH